MYCACLYPLIYVTSFYRKKKEERICGARNKKNANRVMSASGPSEEEQPLQRSRTIRSKRLIAHGTVRPRSSLPGQILPNSDRNSQFPIPKSELVTRARGAPDRGHSGDKVGLGFSSAALPLLLCSRIGFISSPLPPTRFSRTAAGFQSAAPAQAPAPKVPCWDSRLLGVGFGVFRSGIGMVCSDPIRGPP